jgi:SAM-dependent methyltransferase
MLKINVSESTCIANMMAAAKRCKEWVEKEVPNSQTDYYWKYGINDKDNGPFKFIKYPMRHIQRCMDYYNLLKPKRGSLFNIGVGVGYFDYICKQLGGCVVSGIDIMLDDLLIYKKMRLILKIPVREFRVNIMTKIDFGGTYDYITSTLPTFNNDWSLEGHLFFLHDCFQHLNDGGKIFIAYNKSAFNKTKMLNGMSNNVLMYGKKELHENLLSYRSANWFRSMAQ